MPNWAKYFGLPGLVISGVLFVGGLYLNYKGSGALGWPGSLWAFWAGTVFVAILLAVEWQRFQSEGRASKRPTRSIEARSLRHEPQPVGHTSFPDENRAFIPESLADIVNSVARVRPLQRGPLQETYLGKWVRWEGTIVSIMSEGADGFAINVQNDERDRSQTTFLTFPPDKSHIVEQLDEGERVRFEGQITRVRRYQVTLENVTFLPFD